MLPVVAFTARDGIELLFILLFVVCLLFLQKRIESYLSRNRSKLFPELQVVDPAESEKVWQATASGSSGG